MKIDFIISHLNLYGSVRELVELGNNLSYIGCDVTVHTDEGYPCAWLRQDFRTLSYRNKKSITTDVLILMDSPHDKQFELFEQSVARFKTMVMMGFDPTTFDSLINPYNYDNLGINPTQTEKNLRYILKNYEMCADGSWQLDFMKNLGYRVGIAVGGINTNMFKPNPHLQKAYSISISGDPRHRKGTAALKLALGDTEYYQYWGKKKQHELIDFLQRTLVFMDNHNRAGWCNPVLEAMACGCAVVCSDIGANRDFAKHYETAIVVDPNNIPAFQYWADRLPKDEQLCEFLSDNAVQKAKEFDYSIVAAKFLDYLKTRV